MIRSNYLAGPALALSLLLTYSAAAAMQRQCVAQAGEFFITADGAFAPIAGLDVPAPNFDPQFLTVSGDVVIFASKRGWHALGLNFLVVGESPDVFVAKAFYVVSGVRINDTPRFPLSIAQPVLQRADRYAVTVAARWNFFNSETPSIRLRDGVLCLYG